VGAKAKIGQSQMAKTLMTKITSVRANLLYAKIIQKGERPITTRRVNAGSYTRIKYLRKQ